jgi:hypothetical protein
MLAWSYSSLTSFETCPRRHHETRVLKRVKESEGPALVLGNAAHKSLELRAKTGCPLPEKIQITTAGGESAAMPTAGWEEMMTKILATPGEVITERQIALDSRLCETGWFDKNVWVRGVIDLGKLNGSKALLLDHKGLPVDTPIPTPEGFTAIGDLSVGDTVFGGDGTPCLVHTKSDVTERQCYRVTFDDCTEMMCDDQHLWAVHTGEVVPITALAPGHKILLCGQVQYPDRDLPVDPYVLGLWIADGKHTSGEICKPDQFVWDEIQRRGYVLGSYDGGASRCTARTVKNIRGKLSQLGVLRNKHIPDRYLMASIPQRMDLLRGLMDGDGSANTTRKQAVFASTDKRLSDQVKQLLESLGQRVNQSATQATGFGVTTTAYQLHFRPQGINPFLLPRKADKVDPAWGIGQSWFRKVVAVDKSVMMKTTCIGVNSPDNTYLCGHNYLRTHNTGKRKPDNDQLMLFAALAMHVWPKLEKVVTGFLWLKEGKIDKETFTRGDITDIWNRFTPRVKRLEIAHETNTWDAKPSGLCGWCPVRQCEFWRDRHAR